MTTLILAGTLEARRLASAMAQRGLRGVLSLAGRVADPKPLPLPVRIGGFGGTEGLRAYLRKTGITRVIDATHPFAAQMSRHAVAACEVERIPLLALTRPPWARQPEDRWTRVPSLEAAVKALDGPSRCVFLAVGRMHLNSFAALTQHQMLLRLVDPPADLPFKADVVVDRGPFDLAADRALLERHRIDLVVSKNSGGTGAYAKIAAARALGLPVLMIDRPDYPHRREIHSVQQVLDWLDHAGTERGV